MSDMSIFAPFGITEVKEVTITRRLVSFQGCMFAIDTHPQCSRFHCVSHLPYGEWTPPEAEEWVGRDDQIEKVQGMMHRFMEDNCLSGQ